MYQSTVMLKFKRHFYWLCIFFICLCFGIFEYKFIPHEMLTADEFVFARQIYDYTINLPYRDFVPYKTTLGYYLFALPMFFYHQLSSVFYIKYEIAALNIICILIVSYLSMQFFDKRAILITIIAIIANQFFLIYATELRVDMLASWICLISVLVVMHNRISLGGLLFAIAFLISQKSLYYYLAINAGLLCFQVFLYSSHQARYLRIICSLLLFNASMMITIMLYFLFWSILASPQAVYQSLFHEAFIQAGITFYSDIYFPCWGNVLCHGPLLFVLFPLTIISIYNLKKIDSLALRRLGILSFATLALIFFSLYRQAFPYNFVFTIPAFFLLYCDFISWLLIQISTRDHQEFICLKQSLLFTSFIAFYSFSLFLLFNYFPFPIIYNLIPIFPLLFYTFLSSRQRLLHQLSCLGMATIFLITGITYPLYRVTNTIDVIDNGYQYTVLNLLHELVAKEGDYIAGVPYLLEKDQPIAGIKNLISIQTDYIRSQKNSLEPLLLDSLYMSRTNPDKILADLKKSTIKVVIINERTISLPKKIMNYLWDNYQHFYGSIYLYAPAIHPQVKQFELKFSGNYRLESDTAQTVKIDGKHIKPTNILILKKGKHTSLAKHIYHLALVPDIKTDQLNPNYQDNYFLQMIKSILI